MTAPPEPPDPPAAAAASLAEAIETGEQLALLRALGCQLGQGYLMAAPLDPERALAFIDHA